MTAIAEIDRQFPSATDGDIAAINLGSTRRRAWARFRDAPRSPDTAEAVLEKERLCAQFLGDLDALDRLELFASQFTRLENSQRAALFDAEIASTLHRFDDARSALERAAGLGAPQEIIECHTLTIDQACGANLDSVLAARRRIAKASGRVEDLVPLGAVLADVERFAEADAVYRDAFYSYDGISPFPVAWASFQLGVLWGELVSAPDPELAALWYRRAMAYLPGYVKARVHLAEIYIGQNQNWEAEALLLPALSSRDPEVRWRLADVLTAQGRVKEAREHLDAAHCGFEDLVRRHLLAFADHAAEFYASSGSDHERAVELARMNVANRPTRRAIRQANKIETLVENATDPQRKVRHAHRNPHL